jgi:PAS domain S-box-containing protein
LFTYAPEAGLLLQMSTGVVIEANQMFYDLFGYNEDEVAGREVSELNLWACPQRRDDLVMKLKRDGRIENFEAAFLHTDGHTIHVLISGRVVQVQGDSMVVSTIRDISLRKEAENELKKSRQRLKDLQRLAGLATWSYDLRSREVTWSEEAFELAGRDIKQGVPTKEEFYELIHPDDREHLKRTIDTALDSGSAYEAMIRQKGRGEQYRHVLLRGQPIIDDAGNTIQMYGVMIPQRGSDLPPS